MSSEVVPWSLRDFEGLKDPSHEKGEAIGSKVET